MPGMHTPSIGLPMLRITFLEDEDLLLKLFQGKHNVFGEGSGMGMVQHILDG